MLRPHLNLWKLRGHDSGGSLLHRSARSSSSSDLGMTSKIPCLVHHPQECLAMNLMSMMKAASRRKRARSRREDAPQGKPTLAMSAFTTMKIGGWRFAPHVPWHIAMGFCGGHLMLCRRKSWRIKIGPVPNARRSVHVESVESHPIRIHTLQKGPYSAMTHEW